MNIIFRIYCWFMNYIILPIKRWWNYHINQRYLTDNMRTEALFEYLAKVIEDPTYQPNGAYENSFEERLKECHDMVIKDIRMGKHPEIPIDIEVPYEANRREYAIEIYNTLIELPIIIED